jgi:hypothetical protein
MFKFSNITGYTHASASWLNFNEKDQYKNLKAPLLFLHPIRDDLAGVLMPLLEAELALIEDEGMKKLVVFNTTGNEDHCHQLLAPNEYIPHLVDWVRQHSSGP